MGKITRLLAAILSLSTAWTHGQPVPSFTVGDTVDEAIFGAIEGYDPRKALIIDFGTTTCPPCIKSLKLLDSLQQFFPDGLQVFFVTSEPPGIVNNFLARNPYVKGIRIPTIAADTVLHAAFPHISQPHTVWIDSKREVKAITDHHYINKQTLQGLTEGRDFPDWQIKREYKYCYRQPVLVPNGRHFNEDTMPATWYSSFISGQLPGVFHRQHTYVDSATQKVVASSINIPIAGLYATLYGVQSVPSHMILDVADPWKYNYYHTGQGPNLAEWKRRNTYCYEMTFPLAVPKAERVKRIAQQLDWHFGVSSDSKAMKRECWILRVDSSGMRAVSSDVLVTGKGITLHDLHHSINQLPNHCPVFLETAEDRDSGYARLVYVTEAAYNDLEMLRAQLRPYGIKVDVEERELRTLVIRETQQ